MTNITVPEFPLKIVWKESGDEELYRSELELLENLEDFDSGDPEDGDAAIVTDARGRLVHLRVRIWRDICDYRFVVHGGGSSSPSS